MKTTLEHEEELEAQYQQWKATRQNKAPLPQDEYYQIALNVDRGDGAELVSLIRQRDHYKANAGKLAEALEECLPTISAASETGIAAYNKARAALNDWRNSQ